MLQMCKQGLSMVHAEAFLAEVGVFECVNVRDVDPLSRFEFVESMGGVRSRSEETVLVIRPGE